MLKKTISFNDFNGDPQTEDHYFHLSQADLVEMEVSHKEGLSNWLTSIAKSNDGATIIAEFKKLILNSYGKRSDDGKRFIKNQQLRDEFQSTEAYSALFLELCTNSDAASEFVNGIIPAGLERQLMKEPRTPHDPGPGPQVQVNTETAKDPHLSGGHNVFENAPVSEDIGDPVGPNPRVLNEREQREMNPDELRRGLMDGRYTLQ